MAQSSNPFERPQVLVVPEDAVGHLFDSPRFLSDENVIAATLALVSARGEYVERRWAEAHPQVKQIVAYFRKMFDQLSGLPPTRSGAFFVTQSAFRVGEIVLLDASTLFVLDALVGYRFRKLDDILIASEERQGFQSSHDRILMGGRIGNDLVGDSMGVVRATGQEILLRQGGFGKPIIGNQPPCFFQHGDGVAPATALEISDCQVVSRGRKCGDFGQQFPTFFHARRKFGLLQ